MIQEHAKVDPFLQRADREGEVSQSPVATEAGLSSVGATLRAAREERGLTLSDISARLKFGVRQLDALEHERWDELPKGPSLRGLVRNYARLLGLDAEELLQAVPAHLMPAPIPVAGLGQPSRNMQPSPLKRHGGDPARQGRVWLVGFMILVLISLIALAAYVTFTWWLPRMSGTNERSPLNLPYAAGSQEILPINPGAPSTALGDTEAAPASESGGPILAGTASDSRAESDTSAGSSAAAGADSSASPENQQSGDVALTAAAGVAANDAIAQSSQGVGGASTDRASVALESSGSSGQPGPASPPSLGGVGGGAGAPLAVGASDTVAVVAPSSGSPTATAAQVSDTVQSQLLLQVSEDSWVEVHDGQGNAVLYTTLTGGTERLVEAVPPARVVIGNVNGVNLQWRGMDIDLRQYQRGNVARFTLE